jgi:GT2 family glycosyltransferase
MVPHDDHCGTDISGSGIDPMRTCPSVWIVVLNWNGLRDTLVCLQSLLDVNHPGRRIVVVDNGSTDGSLDALRAQASDAAFDLVEAGQNLGYAGGNNLGIRYALERGADFVMLLNNDTTVDPTLIDDLLSAAQRRPDAGCFGPWIYYMHDPDRLWFTRSDWSSDDSAFNAPGKGRLAAELSKETTSTQYVCGAALLFRADVARKIGLLDERFFLVYEDSDWCFRARRAGFECISVPTARVLHKVGTSFGSEASPLRTYFSTRNRLLFAEKNRPRAEWLRMLRRSARRLYPSFRLDRTPGQPMHKSLRWATDLFLREWKRRLRDPLEIAYRRGIVDYVLRRFGDCPPRIRVLTGVWVNAAAHTAKPFRPDA